MTAAETVVEAVRNVAFGPASTFRNLTVQPLVSPVEREPDYVVLDEGLARGWVEITEVTESGRVPELKAVNRGGLPVLLLDGEELLGAKQNRVVNLSILLRPQSSTAIPVSCVESGRWHHASRGFAASPRTMFAVGRAAKMRHVNASLIASEARVSDQHEVWNLIAEKAARLETRSDTSAMAAMYDTLGSTLDEFVSAFPALERQIGAVFIVNGRVAGLELFDAESTWRKLFPKVIRSYALDAIDRARETSVAGSPPKTRAFVRTVMSSRASVFPAVGEGDDVRLAGRGDLVGAALVARGRAVHLSAFPAESRSRK